MSLTPVGETSPHATEDEGDAELAALRSAARKQAEALRQEFRTEMSYLNSFYSLWNIRAPRAYALRPLLAFGGSALALAVFGILALISLALPVSTTIMAAFMPGIAATSLLNAGIRRYRERVVQLEHCKHEVSQIQEDVRKCRARYKEKAKALQSAYDAQREELQERRFQSHEASSAESACSAAIAPSTALARSVAPFSTPLRTALYPQWLYEAPSVLTQSQVPGSKPDLLPLEPLEEAYDLTPTEFENEIAWVFQRLFPVKANVIGKSGDGGVDVELWDRYGQLVGIIQAKRYTPHKALPPGFIRQLHSCSIELGVHAYFVTTARFSVSTSNKASSFDMTLIDGSRFDELRREAYAVISTSTPTRQLSEL